MPVPAGKAPARTIFDRALIVQARTRVAQATSVTLTATFWCIGNRVRRVVLSRKRADYGRRVVERLAVRPMVEFGEGFSRANLFHMVHFAEAFGDTGEVSPDMVLLDHVNLSALGLKDNVSSKRDLEDAMLREIEIALGELGSNFAFMTRQYRFRLNQDRAARGLNRQRCPN